MTVTDLAPPHPADTAQRSGGRVPPHSLPAEASVLGAMLTSRDAILAAVETGLVADDFYKPQHGHVFEAIVDLFGDGDPADVVTVAEALGRRNLLDQLRHTEDDGRTLVGGAVLLDLQARTPATSNAGQYASIVHEKALLRRMIGVAGEIAEMGYDEPDDVPGAVDQAEALVFALAEQQATDVVDSRDLMERALSHIERLSEQDGTITGLATGYAGFDEMLLGLQPGTLVVVGARPAMGKSTWALGVAAHCAIELRRPALLFSLEMSDIEVSQRLISSIGRVDHGRVRSGKLFEADWSKISHAVGEIAAAPLYIDDNQERTVTQMRAAARRLKARLGDLGVVVVDYLQLMGSSAGKNRAENRQVEIAEISRGLKVMARELDVPVIALSQLNRNLELRHDKRPSLADLRESGSLEQDADVVAFLYRDEIYNPESPDRGTAEVIVAKHRAGPTGIDRLAFLGQFQRFTNLARSM